MGLECPMSAPNVAWGYWHDGSDLRGDHRFDWSFIDHPFAKQMLALVKDCNRIRQDLPAMHGAGLDIPHEDYTNKVIAIKRWDSQSGQVVLVIANMGDVNFVHKNYGVRTGHQAGSWTQIMYKDQDYGGWQGSGNAYYHPVNADG